MAMRSSRDTSAENGAKRVRLPMTDWTPSTRITVPPLRAVLPKLTAIERLSPFTSSTRSSRESRVRRLFACLVRVPAMNFWMNASVRLMCSCWRSNCFCCSSRRISRCSRKDSKPPV
jgi:hypothetical protein